MMRPRHVLILVALAAIPVGLAIALTAGHSNGKGAAGAVATQVSLSMIGGTSVSGVSACGIVHHYRAYGNTGTIRFRGLISPAGTAKVKLKLKVCTAGAFRDSGEATATVHSNGSYKGSLPAPINGYYFARAEVKRGGALVARSEKRYFEVR
jgi:hypothetical protein